MFKKTLMILLVLSSICFSCQRKNKPEVKTLTNSVAAQSGELKGEKIPVDELIPSKIMVVDTFLIVFNRKEEYILKIYNAKTYQFISAFLKKGRGPGEIQILGAESSGFMENGEVKLWIRAFPNFFGLLNINQSLKAKQPVYDLMYDFLKDKKAGVLFESNAVYYLGDSTFLLTKDPERSNTLKENPNPFYVRYHYPTGHYSDTLYLSHYQKGHESLPIKDGEQYMRADFKKIAKAYSYMNQILISDLDSGQQIWVTPASTLPTIPEMLIDKEEYHVGIYGTRDQIVVSCAKRYDGQGNIPRRYIEIYDWEGHLQWHLNIVQALWYPYIDEINGYLYGVNENDEIWRYDVKKFLKKEERGEGRQEER